MLFFCRATTFGARALVFAGLAVMAGGCQNAARTSNGGPLAAVAPLPAPAKPPLITSFGPTGQADTLAQIRVIFSSPLIALESLERTDGQTALQSFHIEPALPGHFRFLTPKMVGFQADRALPKATRIKVTVDAGLTNLKGARLGSNFEWTFTTQAVQLSGLPGTGDNADAAPVAPDAGFEINSNVELDAATLAANAAFVAKNGERTGVTAVFKKSATPAPQDGSATFDPSQLNYVYSLKPAQALARGTAYALQIAPGVAPAAGNLPSTAAFKGSFATYGPLRLESTAPAQSDSPRFVHGDPQLRFNNGLDAASALQAISVAPAPLPGMRLLSVNDGDTTVALNPFALKPNTAYTVTVGAQLKDQFGQTLGAQEIARFVTSDLAADFWAPSGLNIFARATGLRLEYSAVNLPGGRYQAAYRALSPEALAGTDESADASAFLPAQNAWPPATLQAAKNAVTAIGVPVAQKLGAPLGFLAYGASAAPHQAQGFTGTVGITNLGVFAQWFPQSGMVMVQHLSDGSPVSGARVDVYRSKTHSPCASATADASGTATFSGTQIEVCAVGAPADGAPSLLAVARENGDWAYARVNDTTGYGYDIYLGWSNGKPDSRGTLFSDRQMYQPGERAAFTGAAYYVQNGVLKRDAGGQYAVTIRDANGGVTSLGSKTADAFGVFTVPWNIPRAQKLGYYTIKAVGTRGNEIYGDFRVAEFKPPNFNVTLNLDKSFASAGQAVVANGKSAYLFGAPLEGGRAHYYVTRSQAYLSPKGRDGYQFGRQWFWPEETPSVDADVLQTDATLDAAGTASQTVTVPADLPYPMSYQVDMDVTDASNMSVSDTQTFTALPGPAVIGVHSDFVGDENKPFPVSVIVTDPNGAATSGANVHVELQAMQYASATQLVEGGESARNAVTYTTVDSADVTSSNAAQSVSLKAPKAGAYRIRANFSNAKSDASETDTQIWISGPEGVRWMTDNPTTLKVSLDKRTYRAGETATALIQSPYPQADVYFSVVRDRVLLRRIVHVRGGAPRIAFTVTADMLPNAAAEAVLVRRGPPLQKIAAGALDSLVRTGFAAFSINLDPKYLKAGITPLHAKIEPGARQTVTLSLRDAAGHAAAGEFAVMVVNDAILQLTGYRLPDLVKTVYADQPISTRLNDNRANVVLSPLASPVAKGFGYGGGFMEGAGSTRVRRNFQQLAYYSGALKTGSDGTAQISFTMPDDLTTWRIMAVASGGTGADFRFATADQTFISTKPLMLNPVLPQFARSGDILYGGVSATNTTENAGDVSIDATLAGALRFVDGDPRQAHAQTALRGTQAVRFAMLAGDGASAQMKFRARLGSAGDAFEIPFEIRNTPLSETVAQSGATQAQDVVPVTFQGGTLQLWLGSSVIPQVVAPGEAALRDRDQLPFSETAASRLGVASALATLATFTGQRSRMDLAAESRRDIATLRSNQAADGGIAWWAGANASDPLLTAYAAENLGASAAAGLASDATLNAALRKTLAATLADPGKDRSCKDADCKAFVRLQALLGLSALGDRRTEFLSGIYERRDTLGFADRARLAEYLLQTPGWSEQGSTLLQKLEENLSLGARTAALNVPPRWTWYDAPEAAQAALLDAMVAARAPATLLDGVVRSLTAQRCTCAFINMYATAVRLRALASYARTQNARPDFSATVRANGKTVASATFRTANAPPKTASLPAAQLNGARQLEFSKQGTGTLHYTMQYTYPLLGPQPGVLGGLRVTRFVRAANNPKVLLTMGLQMPAATVSLPAANVFDVALEVIADHPVDDVVMTDAVPAGLEAVDAAFQTSNSFFQAGSASWQIDYQTIYKDRVLAFAAHLEPGVYEFHYLVRSVTPGTYGWPGGEAHAQYAPEDFGRTASATLEIPR